jgi:hypothetical protein
MAQAKNKGGKNDGKRKIWLRVLESFKRIKYEYPTLKLRPFDGFPENVVAFREGVAELVIKLVYAALLVAKDAETAMHRQQGIGGAVQAAIITAEGPKVADPLWYDKLKAWQIHEGRLE